MDVKKVMQQILGDMKDKYQKEINANVCPEHGTAPKLTLKDDTISAKSCCQAQYEIADAFLKSKAKQES